MASLMVSGVTSQARSNGSNDILLSRVNVSNPSVVTADHALPINEKVSPVYNHYSCCYRMN